MLSFLKSKTSKIVLSIILVIFFVLSLNYKFDFLSKNKVKSNVIATIAGLEITDDELNLAISNFKNEMLSQNQNISNLNKEDEEKLRENILQNIINEKLIINLSQKMKLYFDDEIIIEQIKQNQQFSNEAGLFDENKFDQILKSINMSERQYIDEIKKSIILYLLLNTFNSFSNINLDQINNIFIENFKRFKKIHLIEIDFDKYLKIYKDSIDVSDDEIKDFYEKNINLFKNPEYRSIKYSKIKLNDIKKNLKIEELELNKKLDEVLTNRIENKTNELRSFDNIICELDSDIKDVYDFLSKLNQAEYKDIKISQISKIFKDEKKLNCIIIDVKDKEKDAISSNFSKIVFDELKLENNLFYSKEPITSELGKHILVLRDSREISRDDIMDSTLNELKIQKANESYKLIISEIRKDIELINSEDKKIDIYSKFKEINSKFNLDENIKNSFSINGLNLSENDNMIDSEKILNSNMIMDDDNNLFFNKNLTQNIFSANDNSLNLFQINDNEYILYLLSGKINESIKTIDDAKSQIRSDLSESKGYKNFKDFGSKLYNRLVSKEILIDNIYSEYKWINLTLNQNIYHEFITRLDSSISNPDLPQKFIDNILENQNKNSFISPFEYNYKFFIAYEDSFSYYEDLGEDNINKINNLVNYNTSISNSNQILNSIILELNKRFKVKKYLK